ncbi:Subtilase family protein [Duganella sp. CF517]|uniref:S8 family peptidase n=1 Tax=Duganella sp. CF517 TaxID=1881038 RepID=UPI0008C8D506|nr:S8 family serine peptidase [Duganella sp. CF517]SEN10729.1 Subtilase family protein [Duganella sp. CF517]
MTARAIVRAALLPAVLAAVLATVLAPAAAGALHADVPEPQAAASAPVAGASPPAGDERILPPADDGSLDPGANQLLVMLRLPATHYRPDATYGGRYMDDSGSGGRRRRAEALARQHGMTVVEGWAMSLLGIDCYVMRYKDDADAARIIEQLSRDPQVEWAQPVARFEGMAGQAPRGAPGGDSAPASSMNSANPVAPTAGSPAAADALYPVQPAARYWHVADLHRYTTGREVRVAVIDSGIDGSHPDLHGQLAVNANFVDNGEPPPELHGTAVAGIIAARSGNGGIVGVAPKAKLMGLRACWQLPNQSTRCNSFTLSKAINYAILNGAKVINLSLSGPPDRLLDRLLDVALQRGIGVVGAVDAQAGAPTFPASHRGVLAVASQPSVKVSGNFAPVSAAALMVKTAAAAGLERPLFAPGNDVPTTAPGARWAFVSGSSYAAAHVSGMLALLGELQPGATPAQLRGMLQAPEVLNAVNIDACATISHLIDRCTCGCPAKLTQRGATR